MYQTLQLKQPENVHIPGERTVYRVMEEIGLNHKLKRKPNGITKADIWRYFISYWNNRRIRSANGGLPPMIKRQQYYDSLQEAA